MRNKVPGHRRCVRIIRSSWLNEELRINELRIDGRTCGPGARQIATVVCLTYDKYSPSVTRLFQTMGRATSLRRRFFGHISLIDGRLERFKNRENDERVLSIFFDLSF